MSHHTSRGQTAIVAALMLMLALVGCGPAGPTPGGTLPATVSGSAEAVRAAKQAYLDYTAAASLVKFEDPSTWDGTSAFTTERRQKDDQSVNQKFSDLGWTRTGTINIVSLELESVDEPPSIVILVACVDSSDIHYFDAKGEEQILEGSDSFGLLNVTLVQSTDSSAWVVDDLAQLDGESSCGS